MHRPYASAAMCGAILFAVLGSTVAGAATTLYVSPQGNKDWTGRLAEPNAQHTDGPLPSLEAARDAVRAMKRSGSKNESFTILLRGGMYWLNSTFVLGPEDSGTPEHPVVYAAYPGEQPVLSGGVALGKWRQQEGKIWSAPLQAPKESGQIPRQLFVNGNRKERARFPEYGFFLIGGKSSSAPQFQLPFQKGTIPASWANSGAEAVVLVKWTFLRRPIIAVDTERNVATLAGDAGVDAGDGRPQLESNPAHMTIQQDDGARYYLENMREGLTSEGHWFYDAHAGQLLYWPKPSEDLSKDQSVATTLTTLVRLEGDPASGHPVSSIHFSGLSFQYTNWDDGPKGFADEPQGDVHVAGAFEAIGAEHVSIEQCNFSHLGGYAISFGSGSRYDTIAHNTIADIGAGGVRMGPFPSDPAVALRDFEKSTDNVIADNHIHHIGEVYPSGIGILVGQSTNSAIAHNLIHDTYYTGISLGWTWGYMRSDSSNNTIEYNHLYNICRGMLDDVGGIYILGVSPGTIIGNNLIHDLDSAYVRGRGIYLDEGTSGVLVQNNVVYRVKSAAFHIHYGRNNTVRNNIFAFTHEFEVTLPRNEKGQQLLDFENNIVLLDDGRLLGRGGKYDGIQFNHNLYYDLRGEPVRFLQESFDQWQGHGQDRDSLIANPGFLNPYAGNFALPSDSPAFKIGFKPIDLSTVGPRPITQTAR